MGCARILGLGLRARLRSRLGIGLLGLGLRARLRSRLGIGLVLGLGSVLG